MRPKPVSKINESGSTESFIAPAYSGRAGARLANCPRSLHGHSDVTGPAAQVAFDDHRDFVQRPHLHPVHFPRVEVMAHADGSSGALRREHAPILGKGRDPLLDGGFVDL